MYQLFRFATVGVLNTVTTYCIVLLLHHVFSFALREAGWIGYGVGVLLSFYLNKKWTFQGERAAFDAKIQMGLFLAAGVICAYLYGEVLAALAVYLPVYLAAVFAVAILFLVNFALSRWLVFRTAQ